LPAPLTVCTGRCRSIFLFSIKPKIAKKRDVPLYTHGISWKKLLCFKKFFICEKNKNKTGKNWLLLDF
jgi:hypothetical protein